MIEMNKELLFDIMEEYEKYSIPLIKQLEGNWFASNGDIRWYSNYVHDFTDENITGYYLSGVNCKDLRDGISGMTLLIFL